MISIENVNLLITVADEMEKELIKECLESFEEYHESVYGLELTKMIGSGIFTDNDDYRNTVMDADRSRTTCHNSVISNVGILNRMCSNHGISPIYDGIVSEERPYRRELANAVFEFVEHIIKERS